MTSLKRKFNRTLGKKQDNVEMFPAVMGNGAGQVFDDEGRIYVRVAEKLQTVKNSDVYPINNLPVWVGYEPTDPKTFKILNSRITSGAEVAGGVGGNGSKHANTHEFFGAGVDGGTDVLKVQLGQFMPLKVLPYQGMTVLIWMGIVKTSTGFVLISNRNSFNKPIPKTVDLETYGLTLLSGKSKYLLITINDTGAIIITEGSPVNRSSISLNDIPAEPAGTLYVLAAVEVYFGQSEIRVNREATDIIDLRFPMPHVHSTGDLSDLSRDYQEDFTSQVNGVKVAFETAVTFIAGSVMVYLNGIKQKPTYFTETVGTKTVTLSFTPLTGDELLINYSSLD